MLRIAALQQQPRLWGLPTIGMSGRGSAQDRQSLSVAKAVSTGKGCNWNRGWRIAFSATDSTLRSRSKRRGGVVAMENSSVERRAVEVVESERLAAGEAGLEQRSTFNSTLNRASKWVVVGLVAGGVLWRHDAHAAWFAVGSILNGGLCKCLKYLINQSRPPTADGVKEDPGMPSSHAQGFSYIATYVSLAWLLWQGINVWTSITSLMILLSFAYLSWLRVEEGLHTVAQVLVGGTVGSAASVFWLYVWKAGAEAAVNSSLTAKFFLLISFLVAGAGCYVNFLKEWELSS